MMIKNTKSNKQLVISRYLNYDWDKVFLPVYNCIISFKKMEFYTSSEWQTMEDLCVFLSQNIKEG